MVPLRVLGLLLCTQLCGGTEELRLVGGGGRCAGRVEVKHDGEWGSVCNYDFDWEAVWARVVCRQLRCGPVAHASAYAPFGRGTGRIWLQPFFCRGHEEMLQHCPHFGWGKHFCGHELDVGVTCAEAVELRLVAGKGPCAGRVEAKLQGRWGSVADDRWDMEDAEVVCQQLGCGSATGAHVGSTEFGTGEGPVSLALIDCRGDEAALWDCEIRGWGPYSAIHDFDTAVSCQGFSRLVGSGDGCSGRLEVRRGRAWAGVCQGHVDMKAAQVVCRELGCGTALAVLDAGASEAGAGLPWDGGFECSGTEPLLSACARRPPRGGGCAGRAGIVCSPYAAFRLAGGGSGCAGRVEVEVGGTWESVCASGWDLPDAHVLCYHLGCGPAVSVAPGGSFGRLRRDVFSCSGSERHPGECPVTVLGEPSCPPGHAATLNCSGAAEPLRLVEGKSRCDGVLEVAASPGAWVRVPAGQWDARGASGVCQQLGCGELQKVYTIPGSGTARPPGLRCVGTEESLAQCNASGTAAAPTGGPEELVVICSGSRRVRLAGGSGRCAGRVEVAVNSTWGTVCQDTWDMRDAAVLCRQLGCGAALAVPGPAQFGAGTGLVRPDVGGCAGTEASLWDCPSVAQRGCQRGGGAAAVCSGHLSLRLSGGSSRCSGHLEVLYNGTWGRVCASGTSATTAAIACRQLGCGHRGRLATSTSQDRAPAWLAWVSCEEGAHSFWRCPSAPWHLQSCDTRGDAHVACDEDEGTSGTPTPSPGSLCPDGATCTGAPTSPTLAAATGIVTVPTALCVVLGTLLCLATAALAVQTCRARARQRGPGKAVDITSDAVYEELDYTLMPEYQEVLGRSGSPAEGSATDLPYYTGDSVEESDPKAASDPPALPKHSSLDGYDDAMAVPAESPAPGTGNISEGVSLRSWGCDSPTGGSCPPEPSRDPPPQRPEDTDYDDAGVGPVGTSL
ncbi:LOW QUALITY PROTEIN: antigen WC1.1-like [Colius striatus]|uniref:LOW QUALITY PROTEIN: antigen WC1.1-like n=1 Tax=Colius striatus TaxID=57412 RepID=UPI002B1D35E5|nr:LOW QUALITY PROTEIN: antigen WC1.1-like [Colius striatus]